MTPQNSGKLGVQSLGRRINSDGIAAQFTGPLGAEVVPGHDGRIGGGTQSWFGAAGGALPYQTVNEASQSP